MTRRSRNMWVVFVLAGGVLAGEAVHSAYDSAAPGPKGDVHILRVIPVGKEVPAGQQITITFDRPMRALGAQSVSDAHPPVTLSPAIACSWHWLDPRSL